MEQGGAVARKNSGSPKGVASPGVLWPTAHTGPPSGQVPGTPTTPSGG
eukprot:CAMPEP_0169477622 /NCGR_PEP_ID=MMETSP1042-20121227/28029_1 /TAXON_ID=464988 /ORGANISM="Hemiselmis andersenii, Strain CCMP1180" /LENGTH=47 /DNA_ID= /DNA_START= /DNA_END= /DNA_ORIENTATION=